MSGLYELSLSQVRQELLDKKHSVTEVVQSCLDRIEATEGKLHACVTVLKESALRRAEELDAAGPDPAKPLWGVPVTLKDLICLKGAPTTGGSKMLENFVPFYDAEVAVRLQEAGAVIIAKTNMDEFGMGSTTEHSAFGRTANPWDLQRVPGGSSGGSAAGVAAMQAYASLGSDTGGSIRQPAGLCGCVGIKPTYGRVSRYGVSAYGSSFDQVGPLARGVVDCARVFEVIAGPDAKDSTSARLDLFPEAKLPPQNFLAAALEGEGREPAVSLKGLRIGLPQEFWESDLSPDVDVCCRELLQRMVENGAKLVPLSLPRQKYAVAVYQIMAAAEATTNLARLDGVRYGHRTAEKVDNIIDLYTKSRTEGLGEEVQRRITLGNFVLSAGYYDAYYRKAAQLRRLLREDFERALAECDLLAAPSCLSSAWHFGYFEEDPLKAYKMDSLTVTLNIVGLPGLALPAGLGKQEQMPVGIQFMGRPFDEAALLRTGAAVEKLAGPLGRPRACV